jgi:hypothetical protein
MNVTNLESALVPNRYTTAGNVSVTDSAATGLSALHASTKVVLLSVDGADLRYTLDGTDAAADAGHPLADGSSTYLSRASAEAISLISESGTATVRVTEFCYARSNAKNESLDTVPFRKLYEAIIRMRELDPATADLSAAQKDVACEHASMAIEQVWTMAFWPTLCPIERREVTEEGLEDDDGEDLGTLRYIPRRAAGTWPLGTVKAVSCRNPNATDHAGYIDFSISRNGCEIGSLGGDHVWVHYRLEPPTYTMGSWKANETVSTGDIRYWSATGECYEALTDIAANSGITPANVEYWDVCPVPKMFFNYARLFASAMWLEEDGMAEKANARFVQAERELDRLFSRVFDQQQQFERAGVSGYGAASANRGTSVSEADES